MNRQAAEEHVLQLAKEHKILVQWRQRTWTKFEAHLDTRMVWIGTPTTPLRYLACLHEMGHIVSPVARAARRFHHLTEEAAAWDWALDNADPRLMPDDITALRKAIGPAWASYLVVG